MNRFAFAMVLTFVGSVATESMSAQSVTGVVRSAEGEPIAYASISVSAQPSEVRADRSGVFRLRLGQGVHVVTARRIGFLASTITLNVGATMSADTVVITLKPNPNELRGLVVKGERENQFEMTTTSETLRNAPPLGESDVFRTLPLLPSISQPNDITNAIHLAGGASDEHAVTLDGFPLQSPFHFGNVFGAFNVAALDRANVLMHHIPALRDGYLSGEIALETRRAGVRASTDLSITVLSASVTRSQPLPWGMDLLVSGRTTYLDKILATMTDRNGGDDLDIPGYRDALIQLKRERSLGWSWNVLGYLTRDAAKESHLEPGEHPLTMRELLIGARVSRRELNWNAGLRLSFDRNSVDYAQLIQHYTDTVRHLERDRIDQRWMTSELDFERTTSNWTFRGSAIARLRDHRFEWATSFIDFALNTPVPAPIDAHANQLRIGIGGEASRALRDSWNLTVGSHVSVVSGKAYVAPRALLSRPLTPAIGLSIALDRRYQFDAVAGDPVEVSVQQPSFLISKPRSADGVAISLNGASSSSARAFNFSASTTVYARKYRNQTYARAITPSARDSQPANMQAPAFERLPGYTLGVGTSVQVSSRRGDALQLSYTRQASRIRVDDAYQPTDWDARNQVSAFASIALTRHLTFNTVFQAHTGPATSPVAARIFVQGEYGYEPRFIYGSRNSANFPGYQRLDLGFKYAWRIRSSEWGVSLQAVNALYRTNSTRYSMAGYLRCVDPNPGCGDRGESVQSLPIVPSLGFSVKW